MLCIYWNWEVLPCHSSDKNKIKTKLYSNSDECKVELGCRVMDVDPDPMPCNEIKFGDYISCKYDYHWCHW